MSEDIATPLSARVENAPIERILVELIDTAPFQPRKSFPEESIRSLALTIEQNGQLPIWVRAIGERYPRIAGERRTLAIRHIAEKNSVASPSILAKIIPCNDTEAMQLCAIENVREELLPSEQARQCQILQAGGLSHREIADCLGRPRFSESRIAKWLEVAGLPERVQKMLDDRQIKMTHVAILSEIAGSDNQIRAASMASTGNLSNIQLNSRTQHLPKKSNGSPSRKTVIVAQAPTTSEKDLFRMFIRLEQAINGFPVPQQPNNNVGEQARKLLLKLQTLIEQLPQ